MYHKFTYDYAVIIVMHQYMIETFLSTCKKSVIQQEKIWRYTDLDLFLTPNAIHKNGLRVSWSQQNQHYFFHQAFNRRIHDFTVQLKGKHISTFESAMDNTRVYSKAHC